MTDPTPAASEPMPYVVEPFDWSDFIKHPGGETYRLLYDEGDRPRFEHRCDRGDRGVIICAPRLMDAHTVTHEGPGTRSWPNGAPTVTPSILCTDCGTHGFIRNGYWSAA